MHGAEWDRLLWNRKSDLHWFYVLWEIGSVSLINEHFPPHLCPEFLQLTFENLCTLFHVNYVGCLIWLICLFGFNVQVCFGKWRYQPVWGRNKKNRINQNKIEQTNAKKILSILWNTDYRYFKYVRSLCNFCTTGFLTDFFSYLKYRDGVSMILPWYWRVWIVGLYFKLEVAFSILWTCLLTYALLLT